MHEELPIWGQCQVSQRSLSWRSKPETVRDTRRLEAEALNLLNLHDTVEVTGSNPVPPTTAF